MLLHKSVLDIVNHDISSFIARSDATASPVMMERLADIDVIALDAAVSTGLAGERAKRLIKNRGCIAPQHLPKLLITVHSADEARNA